MVFIFKTTPAYSQSKNTLKQIIFDPVLLDPVSGQGIPFNQHAITSFQHHDDAGSSQSVNNSFSSEAPGNNISQHEGQVAVIEGNGGPFSTELYEALLDLAKQYQLLNDHDKAIATFERAEYVSRINHGLFHPEQFASIEGLIDSFLATGDTVAANEKQRYLVYLSEQYFGKSNLNTLPSLIRLADKNMEAFSQMLGKPRIPTISFTSGIQAGPDPGMNKNTNITPRQMAFGSLYQAQQNYVRAITTLLENKQYFEPDLLRLEYNYLETLFLQSFRSSMIDEPDYYLSNTRNRTGSHIRSNFNRRFASGYKEGRSAFERMLIYIGNNPSAQKTQLITILLEYGDWNMLFGRTKIAMTKYREAYDLMLSSGFQQSQIDHIIRPALPVHLPLITTKPNSREKFGIAVDESLEYEGYVDIAFTISRYGRIKKIEILAKTDSVTKQIENRLRKYLRNSPFRPTLGTDGEFTANRVSLRYYVAYADQMYNPSF